MQSVLRLALSGLVRSEVAELRRKAVGGCVLLAAAVMFCIAVALALVAFYLWLATFMPAWQAAAIIAAGVFFVALVLFFIGRRILRRRLRRHADAEALALNLQARAQAAPQKETSFGLTAAAMVAGFVLGRRLMR